MAENDRKINADLVKRRQSHYKRVIFRLSCGTSFQKDSHSLVGKALPAEKLCQIFPLEIYFKLSVIYVEKLERPGVMAKHFPGLS